MATNQPLNIPITITQIFELVKQLPAGQKKRLVKVLEKENLEDSKEADFEIPEWQKKIVRARVKSAKKSNFKSWSEVKKQLKHK